MLTMHFELMGKLVVPCRDLMEWAKWFETANRVVAQTEVGSLFVSTVFLGLDHNFLDSGQPLLFETMIFDGRLTGDLKNSPESIYCDRASDWDAAEAMHRRAVTLAEQMVAKAEKAIQAAPEGPAEAKKRPAEGRSG